MPPRWDAELARVRSIADRVARGYGLEIFDIQFRRESIGWVLRIVIDGVPAEWDSSGGGPGDSVGIEDCQRVSQDVGTILDVEGVLDGESFGHPYTLEVSSPGLDRPLRGAPDYRRFAGRLAKIVVAGGIDGQTHFAGRLMGLDEDTVILEEGRRTHRIPLPSITRARLEVEF